MKQRIGRRMAIGFSFVTVLVAALAVGLVGTVFGSDGYLNGTGSFNAYYGTTYNCGLCHTTPTASSSARNLFGAAWRTAGYPIPMTAALAALDSDGDTFSNGAEVTARTNPGDAASFPSTPPPPDTTRPSVTINQAAAQADPTSASPINFRAVFSEVVTGFATGEVTISGTAGATTGIVTGSGTTYNIAVSGMTSAGTVIASIAANVAQDAAANLNTASTSTDNTVTYTPAPPPPPPPPSDTTRPSVTINQAPAQADPTSASPINFRAVFSEVVTGFATGEVTISGTAGATTGIVTGSGTTYNIAVSGMTSAGTVIASIAANVAQDAAANLNTASTSTDNTVTYTLSPPPPPPPSDTTRPSVTINQAAAQADPTSASPINFTAVFSEPVTGSLSSGVMISGTAGATTGIVTGSGTTYNVAVSGMTSAGTVIVSIAANVAQDAATNGNTASTSTDNTVTYTLSSPPPPPPPSSGECPTTFSNPTRITNKYLPLSSLVQDILEGDMGGVTERVERTMLEGTKTFMCGDQEVETLIMEDRAFVDGVLEEVALDYFAQGDDGTVYYFGEDVEHFDADGNMIGTDGSWLYGVDTDQLGVIMPGRPKVRMKFQAENVPGITTENDKVVSLSKTVRVPAGRFRNCVQIQESLSDGTIEYKYYAPGVGVVKEVTPDGDLNLISHNAHNESDHGGGEND